MNNFSTFVGIIGTLFGIVVAILTIAEKKNISKKVLAIIASTLVVIIGAGLFFLTSTTIVPHPPRNPLVFNATEPPTATPSPTPTPIPIPTPKVIPENLNITCLNCNGNMAYSLKLDGIEIDYANQQTIVKFTIIDIGSWGCDVVFDKLEFQDDSGTIFKAQNVGQTLGNLASGNPLIVKSIFNLVPQANTHYLLSTTLHCSYNAIDYKTQDFVFN